VTPLSTPDPIGDPSGYQRYLLSLLGHDDPAEVQSATPAAWRSIVERSSDLLPVRPEPGEWSVLECLAHTTDAEIVSAGRYRWIMAHDEPPLIGYDQDLWVDNLHDDADDPEAMLRQFEVLRTGNIALWRASSDADRARVSVHRERGPESYDLMFRMLGGHDRVHLAQAYRAIEAANANAR
jgi:hypothetical protein